MNKRIILLNGAPSSGKDTVASSLSNFFGYNHQHIAKSLVDLAISISGVSNYDWRTRYDDRIKNSKDMPWDKLSGLSQREFLIKISEEWIKPVFGRDYFAKKTIISNSKIKPNIVISDLGFKEELDSFVRYYGTDNVLLVRLHREGVSFRNDSRSMLDHKHSIDIHNNTMKWEDERINKLREISNIIDNKSLNIWQKT